jgi:F420-dependent oxidoreductase-like protein
VLLGIGTSGPQVAEGWHGQRFGRQLQRTREYVEVVRMALRRERLEYRGETLELPLPDGPGKALKLTIALVQERIPVYIAAIGPRNTALAAEIADGWLPTLFSPEHVAILRPLLEQGFARADDGKSFGDFDIAPMVSAFVTDDRAAARDAMRPHVALYVGGMGSREQNFYNEVVRRYGFEDAAREVQELYLEGRKEEAAAALPGELSDAVSVCGPADVVRERLAVFRDAGVGTLIVSPMAWSFTDRREQLRLVAELAG